MAARVAEVRARVAAACERAGRDTAEVTLIAASKWQPVEAMLAASEAGITDFGENYVQEAAAKVRELAARPGPADLPRFHLIGHLQSNKAQGAIDACDVVHSVDSVRLAAALERAAHGGKKPVFIQVNLAAEESKGGVLAADVPSLVARVRESPSLALLGLMTLPPAGPPEDARAWFRALKQLAVEHGLEGLSMGMTDDFEVAIEEGATHIRVGRAIFGERRS